MLSIARSSSSSSVLITSKSRRLFTGTCPAQLRHYHSYLRTNAVTSNCRRHRKLCRNPHSSNGRHDPPPPHRLFSSTAQTTTSTTTTTSKARNRWNRIALWIRYTRIPILVVSVYSLGYQQGVIDCTKTPKSLEEQLMNSILLSTTGTTASGTSANGENSNNNKTQIVLETEISFFSNKTHHQVAAVGHKIICAARDFVEEQLQQAMDQVKSQLPPDITNEQATVYFDQDEDVQFWFQARLRLQGEDVKNKPWQYIFVDSPSPNAFVTEILPQRFFITTAMLKIAETPDELAMVLGHEISHLLLGHVSRTNQVETFLRTLEVLLLTMDPTSGILALGVIAGLAALRKALSAAHSRETEREADDLGLQLAARACFDTNKGADVLYKMHQLSVGAATPIQSQGTSSATNVTVQLMDTHPPSLERWQVAKEKSETENYTKYSDKQCATATSRMLRAIWSQPKQ